MVVITDLEDDHPAAATAAAAAAVGADALHAGTEMVATAGDAGRDGLHPDDGDRAFAAAAVGSDTIHAGTEMVATAGDAGGDGLHPDDGDRAFAAAAVGADTLHAGTEMVATAGDAGGDGLRPDGVIVQTEELALMDLPDDLLAQIVVRLQLKDAVVTSVLSKRWANLWKCRSTLAIDHWRVHLYINGASATRVLNHMRDIRPYNIQSFSLVSEQLLEDAQLYKFMEIANQRNVRGLLVSRVRVPRVYTSHPIRQSEPAFTLPHSNPVLQSLVLKDILVKRLFCHDREPFHSLGFIQLDAVYMTRNTFRRLMNLCPALHYLDIRRCRLGCHTYLEKCDRPEFSYRCPSLKRVIIAHSLGDTRLDADTAPLLESFWFYNDFLDDGFTLPHTAALHDLYLCFTKIVSSSPTLCDRLTFSLPNSLSCLKVLTICSRTLRIALASLAGNKFLDMMMLKELQLLFFGLDCENLGHAYAFLNLCKCPELKRVFVEIHKDYVDGTAEEMIEHEQPSGLGSFDVAKVTGVSWTYPQIQLIRFLVKTSKVVHLASGTPLPENVPGLTDPELVSVTNLIDAANIVITKAAATDVPQPFHREAYLD